MTLNHSEQCLELTARIVTAYIQYNHIPANDLIGLIAGTYDALTKLGVGDIPQPKKPSVTIHKSIFQDHIVCLEDGKKFKSLKRHLRVTFGLSPADYRAKWGLSQNYPMVAPAYSAKRSALAKAIGLGRKA